jgi:uncharacterized protein
MTRMRKADDDPEAEVIRLLESPGAIPATGPVSHMQAHCAHVFLGADVALKINRVVRYDCLDEVLDPTV